jgi:hypothetical protein
MTHSIDLHVAEFVDHILAICPSTVVRRTFRGEIRCIVRAVHAHAVDSVSGNATLSIFFSIITAGLGAKKREISSNPVDPSNFEA